MNIDTVFLYGNCSLEDIQTINTAINLEGKITVISSKTILFDMEQNNIESILQMDKEKIKMSSKIYIVKSNKEDSYLSILLKNIPSDYEIFYI